MLTAIRKVARGWVAIVFIAVLTAAFAMWGINDMFRPVASNNVAQGDDVAISANEFANLFDRTIERMREQQPGLTKNAVIQEGGHTQLLDSMIGQRAMERLARRIGIIVPNTAIAGEIQNEKAFIDQISGQFSLDAYRERLAANKISEAEYEDSIRSDLQLREMFAATTGGLRAPQSMSQFLLNFTSEQRVFSLAEIPLSKAGPPPKPTDADLKTLYDRVKAQFPVPETRKLTLVVADPADFVAKVVVPEEELQKLFEFQKPRLSKPELRSFVQIVAPNEAAARDAAARLAKGEPAEAVAQAVRAQPPLTFTDTAIAAVPDQAIAKEVFGLKAPGAIVARGATWSAARLEKITPAVTPSFEALRPDLQRQAAQDQAEELLTKASEAYDEAVGGGASIEDAAKTAGLRTVSVAAITSAGTTPEGAPVALIGTEKELLQTAFEAPQDEPTDFVPLASGASIKVRVDAITPATTRTLDELRPQLAQSWVAQKQSEKLVAVAKKIEADVKAGKSFEAAVGAQGLKLGAKGARVTKEQALLGPMAELFLPVFAGAKGAIVSTQSPVGSIAVIQIDDIVRADPKTMAGELEQSRMRAGNLLRENMVLALQESAIAAAKIKRNTDKLNQTVGVPTPTEGQPSP
jgi:peptidyl-prolyl cis-trans isomerase D